MEVIRITNINDLLVKKLPPLALSIGYFDGVHIGHQKVIGEAKDYADRHGLKSACLTFDPSPKAVLGNNPEKVKYITLLEDKVKLIENLQVDYLFIVPFTRDLAGLTPEQFIHDYILRLNVKHLVAGFDYTYGKFGKGNMDTIEEHGKGHYTVTTVGKITKGQEKISSTYIRELIATGNVEEIPNFLGRYYTMTGKVIHGQKRGRQIGFPTANIQISHLYTLPSNGVYIVRLRTRNRWINGVCSFGYNPTFNDDQNTKFLEVHLIDFNDDIYGESVVVEWRKRLRDELKFNSVEELVIQIASDKQKAIEYFNN